MHYFPSSSKCNIVNQVIFTLLFDVLLKKILIVFIMYHINLKPTVFCVSNQMVSQIKLTLFIKKKYFWSNTITELNSSP